MPFPRSPQSSWYACRGWAPVPRCLATSPLGYWLSVSDVFPSPPPGSPCPTPYRPRPALPLLGPSLPGFGQQTTRGSVDRSKRLSRCTPGASEGSLCSPLLVYLGSNLGGFQQAHHGSCWPVLNGCPKPFPARFPTIFVCFFVLQMRGKCRIRCRRPFSCIPSPRRGLTRHDPRSSLPNR